MKLDLNTLKLITNGASRVEFNDGAYSFYRFTQEQEEMYKERKEDFYRKTYSTSGITLRFMTDSTALSIDALIEKSSSRSYFAFDVLVNGKIVDSLQNYCETELTQNYTGVSLHLEGASKTFDLGRGDKEVTVFFPWSVKARIKEISLDGSYVKPIKYSKKLLAFGDSITHGYDALHPMNKYITRLADSLEAEEYNKAIGGEIFWPALALTKENFVPDYITVAYGTNDWSNCKEDVFVKSVAEFYTNLSNTYPDSKIFAFTPIWRKDHTNPEKAFSFFNVGKTISDACSKLTNVNVIPGYDLVPHDEKYYADLRLHPNDAGFDFYFQNALKLIKENL